MLPGKTRQNPAKPGIDPAKPGKWPGFAPGICLQRNPANSVAYLGKNLLSDLWDGDVDDMTVDEVKAMNVSLLRRFLRAKNSAGQLLYLGYISPVQLEFFSYGVNCFIVFFSCV